jgi:hypothetical protein
LLTFFSLSNVLNLLLVGLHHRLERCPKMCLCTQLANAIKSR